MHSNKLPRRKHHRKVRNKAESKCYGVLLRLSVLSWKTAAATTTTKATTKTTTTATTTTTTIPVTIPLVNIISDKKSCQ